MAAETPKAPTIYTLRRNLDPVPPALLRFEYQEGSTWAVRTVLITRFRKQALALPEGIESYHLPQGEPLWFGALGFLGSLDGLPLVKLTAFMPRQVTYTALVDLADLGILVGQQGVEMEYVDPIGGEVFPFGWPLLARLCLRYAGARLPDLLLGRLIMEELQGPPEDEVQHG